MNDILKTKDEIIDFVVREIKMEEGFLAEGEADRRGGEAYCTGARDAFQGLLYRLVDSEEAEALLRDVRIRG